MDRVKNRRNYYRVLNVQPDAPLAVVKASYRALMQKLGVHPDLGGDGAHARLLNEAYAVISDPARRAEYDRQHAPDALRRPGGGEGTGSARTGNSPYGRSGEAAQAEYRQAPKRGHCLFCGALQPQQQELGLPPVCANCGSPQRQVDGPVSMDNKERSLARIQREGAVRVYTHWPQARPYTAWLTDLSPTGLGLRSQVPLRANSVIKVEGAEMQAILHISNCQSLPAPGAQEYRCGGRFLTLSFDLERGNFVCTTA